MHAGGGTNDHGEKRNVLIVSVLLLIGSKRCTAIRSGARGSGCLLLNVKGTFIGMSESGRGIISGAETATSVPCQEKPEEPYDPQQTSTQRDGDPMIQVC
jgi:hypothetical protein